MFYLKYFDLLKMFFPGLFCKYVDHMIDMKSLNGNQRRKRRMSRDAYYSLKMLSILILLILYFFLFKNKYLKRSVSSFGDLDSSTNFDS